MIINSQTYLYRSVSVAVISLFFSSLAIAGTVVRDVSGPRLVTEDYFGMHVRWGATTPYWPQARFRAWRVITSETTWYALERKKGDWRFESLDRAIATAEAHKVEVLYTLGYPPKRAVSPRLQEAWNPGLALPPQDMQDWADYVLRVAERYKGRIKYYELMNEPHFSEVDAAVGKSDFPVATMVEMARIASTIIKRIDPNAQLLSMAPSGLASGVRRTEAFLKAGGGLHVDALAFHCYDGRGPERIPEVISELRSVMTKYGVPNLDIWNTESGYYIDGPDVPNQEWKPPQNYTLYSPEEGGSMVSRALILGAASGLRRFFWYSWDIPTMALTNGKGKVIAPAGYAYIKTERWLRNATITECLTSDNTLWMCGLTRGPRRAWLVWSVSGDRDWIAPVDWLPKQYETLLDGTGKINDTGRIRIGKSPLLIQSDEQPWGTP